MLWFRLKQDNLCKVLFVCQLQPPDNVCLMVSEC